jgi:hypothetical protein
VTCSPRLGPDHVPLLQYPSFLLSPALRSTQGQQPRKLGVPELDKEWRTCSALLKSDMDFVPGSWWFSLKLALRCRRHGLSCKGKQRGLMLRDYINVCSHRSLPWLQWTLYLSALYKSTYPRCPSVSCHGTASSCLPHFQNSRSPRSQHRHEWEFKAMLREKGRSFKPKKKVLQPPHKLYHDGAPRQG